MLEIGSLVDGKYKILNRVGQGGMSVVYLAMNEKANKQWAVKEVRKDGVLDFEAVKQGLIAETEILKHLNHRNLPSIVDVIDTEDSFIIIMDYIQGNDLMKLLDEYGAQPQENVVEWGKQLADVLLYLHTQDPPIIYRDLKPKNIMLKPEGDEITLIDFGTARQFKENKSGDTVSLGTPEYAAPEQYGGNGQTDARTDIYGFGATMYHLLTGVRPEPLNVRPIREINPALSSGLESIILKCTQHDAQNRYQSAAELIYALEHYKDGDTEHRKKQKKKLITFLVPAVLSLFFAGVSIWGYVSSQNKLSDNYDYNLLSANLAAQEGQTAEEVIEKFKVAIVTDPTRTEAYIGNSSNDGMVDYLLKDGELSQTEGGYLNGLRAGLDRKGSGGFSSTVKVLDELASANPEGYQDVCFEIGEAYLFYYAVGVEKDKYKAASQWFQNATEKYPEAQMYCDIYQCLEAISQHQGGERVTLLEDDYKSLWSLIGTLKTNADDFDDDLRLRAWNQIVNMIAADGNCDRFCEVSGREAVIDLIQEIVDKSSEITSAFAQDSVKALHYKIARTSRDYEFDMPIEALLGGE